MVKLWSMPSIGNPSGFVPHQEKGMSKVFKDCVHLLPSPGVGRDATRLGFFNLRPCQLEEPWKPIDQLLESIKCVEIDSMVRRPILIDAQVPIYSYSNEMKDLISRVAEIYPSKDLAICKKQSHSPEKMNPTLSTKKKKKNDRKKGRERYFHRKNSSHAFESLLSIIANRKHPGKSAIRTLKTSGPELSNLLNQFSAGIAGTGMAVVFSVIGRAASGRVPLCASRLVNTGFGFGLVWVAWAVNGLREAIVAIRKNSNKTGLKEDERLRKVDVSVKEIYFRAATLLALAFLKLA